MDVCCCVNKATSEDSKPEHPRKENVFQVQTYHCLLPFHTCPHLLHKHISLFLLNTLHIYFPMLSTPKTSAQQLDQLLHSHSNALLDCIVAIYKDAKALPEIPPFLKQCMSDLFFLLFSSLYGLMKWSSWTYLQWHCSITNQQGWLWTYTSFSKRTICTGNHNISFN